MSIAFVGGFIGGFLGGLVGATRDGGEGRAQPRGNPLDDVSSLLLVATRNNPGISWMAVVGAALAR